MPIGYANMDGDIQFCGNDTKIPPLPGGLGKRYLASLETNGRFTHQVNPISGATDKNSSIREWGIQVATEMMAQDVGVNDVVAICSRVHAEQTMVILGTLLAGATVAPIDPDWNIALLKNVIQKVKPKMIFCDNRVLGYLEQAMKEIREHLTCQFVLFSDQDPRSFKKKFLKSKSAKFTPVEIKDPKSAIAFIMPSQGTTQMPELVSISHYAISVQTYYIRTMCMPNTEVVATFSTLAGAVQIIISCFCFEYPVTKVLQDNFTERTVCKAIQECNVDTVWLGYGHANKLANHEMFNDYNFEKFNTLIVIGSPVSAMGMSTLRKVFSSLRIVECYTLTEMTFLVTSHNINDYNLALAKPNSCGPLLEGIRCKVVDMKSAKSVGPNNWGELYIRGPAVMLGYFKNTDSTKTRFENNWLRTGDGGQFDEDANLYVCGRITDLLNLKGKWIPPSDIEEVIAQHPGIDEVTVIGMKDFLIACIVKKADKDVSEAGILEFVAEKLPPHKRPQQIKFVKNLPKTHAGNVRRNELREQFLHIRIERVQSVLESRSGELKKKK